MKKKITALVLTGLVLAAFLLLSGFTGGDNVAALLGVDQGKKAARLSGMMYDQSEMENIMVHRVLSDIVKLDEIRFDNMPLMYDASSSSYFYVWAGADETDPVVTYSAPEGIWLAFAEGGFSAEAVRANRRLTFLAYTEAQYCVYQLVFTTLPVMSLAADSEISDTDTLTKMTLVDGASVTTSLASVHIRGASSRLYPKSSYKMELIESRNGQYINNDENLLGLRNDNDWILYAPYNDPENMRALLANQLWMDFGARNNSFEICGGADGRFIELFVNGNYAGLYVLMYPIDKKQAELKANDDPNLSEYVYRSISYVETTELDFLNAADSNIAGAYELRLPKDAPVSWTKWQPLARILRLAKSAPDEEFAATVFQLAERANMIDFWLFSNATCAVDNSDKNVNYIFKRRGYSYVMLVAPQDLDQTWGNIWVEGSPLMTEVQADILDTAVLADVLMRRAITLNVDGVCQEAAQRWWQLRAGVLSNEAVLSRVDAYEAEVFGSGAILRDQTRWPQGACAPDAETFKEYVIQRLAFMDNLMERCNNNELTLQ